MTLAIDIAVEHEAWTALGDLFARVETAVAAALDAAGETQVDGAELSVVLADDAFVRNLNARWRGKDCATNVLSFPAAAPPMLGDIVVAYETASREAAAAGHPLTDYLAHLVVHGTFHLLGHDHEDDAEADAMERLESIALSRLGIASPYEVAS